jgi:hypothetical protein
VRGDGGCEMSDKYWLVLAVLILVLFLSTISKITGFNDGIENMQKEAVIKGHAEWVADTNGKPQFKWKERK